jgi:hypothetical protein
MIDYNFKVKINGQQDPSQTWSILARHNIQAFASLSEEKC